MIQAADGATIEISNMLQRMRELSVQAQNGTNKDTDLEYLQKEFWQLQAEIERIADNTQWNGKNILDGTPGDSVADLAGQVSFQVGANQSQRIAISFGDFETKKSATVINASTVTNADNEITLSGHGFATGDAVLFAQASSTNMGLTSGNTYYVIWTAANKFKLADSYQNALAGTVQGLANTGADGQSLTKVSSYNGNIDATTINVKTAAGASTALLALDKAIEGLDSQRATYGSVINRLQYALDNLTNVSMNTSASKSRIQDADYARETSELARTQIIQQAATAMLSQANTLPQTVLQLLQQ